MAIKEIILSIIMGLIVNECGEVSSWAAYKLVSWAAYHKYVPRDHAELRAEEFRNYIKERPGELFKLITALSFAVWSVTTRKVLPLATKPVINWSPAALAIKISHQEVNRSKHPNSQAARQTWYQLKNELERATNKICKESSSWRHNIKQLRRITRDKRWDIIEANFEVMDEIRDSGQFSTVIIPSVMTNSNGAGWAYRSSVITDLTVVEYRKAAQTTCKDINRLIDGFLGNVTTDDNHQDTLTGQSNFVIGEQSEDQGTTEAGGIHDAVRQRPDPDTTSS